jgi:aldose 1-epimerase
MRVEPSIPLLLPLALQLLSLAGKVAAGVPAGQAPDWPFDVTEISAPDGSITAKFVSVGATLTELWVKDRNGEPRDVVIGYDDNTKLLTDPYHPVFNGIIGRYAGRIKNGTFSIPITKDPNPPVQGYTNSPPTTTTARSLYTAVL